MEVGLMEVLNDRLKEIILKAKHNRIRKAEHEEGIRELNKEFDMLSNEAAQYFQSDVNKMFNFPEIGKVKLEIKPCFTVKNRQAMIEALKSDPNTLSFVKEDYNEASLKAHLALVLSKEGVIPYDEEIVSQYDKPILRFKQS